ncbi:MAG: NAD-dependent epimerase/dehydratase family protein [Proteobacteria bacterium]|nr:NAD-dependent epimerase/dehydratase family protein [Pseudomonadota bacterium]
MLNKLVKVLVTGATGFIGIHLCRHLLAKGYQVVAIGRKAQPLLMHQNLQYHCIENIDNNTDWRHYLKGVNVVIHLAAKVHHLQDKGLSGLTHYQEINVKGTQHLARVAIQNEVKRFILISTIKVIGEKTIEMALRAEDQPRALDAYSLSKLQAEQILQEEAKRSGMEWVIIRPPLVYGPGVKGNFARLSRLAQSALPLPLGAVRNRRSLVSVYNLCSFIECAINHPNAKREIFLVSDNQDLSTAQMVSLMRHGFGKKSRLFPFPVNLLKLVACLLGKRREMIRLVDSLQVNIEKSMRLLNWQPPFTVEQAIEKYTTETSPSAKTI